MKRNARILSRQFYCRDIKSGIDYEYFIHNDQLYYFKYVNSIFNVDVLPFFQPSNYVLDIDRFIDDMLKLDPFIFGKIKVYVIELRCINDSATFKAIELNDLNEYYNDIEDSSLNRLEKENRYLIKNLDVSHRNVMKRLTDNVHWASNVKTLYGKIFQNKVVPNPHVI